VSGRVRCAPFAAVVLCPCGSRLPGTLPFYTPARVFASRLFLQGRPRWIKRAKLSRPGSPWSFCEPVPLEVFLCVFALSRTPPPPLLNFLFLGVEMSLGVRAFFFWSARNIAASFPPFFWPLFFFSFLFNLPQTPPAFQWNVFRSVRGMCHRPVPSSSYSLLRMSAHRRSRLTFPPSFFLCSSPVRPVKPRRRSPAVSL